MSPETNYTSAVATFILRKSEFRTLRLLRSHLCPYRTRLFRRFSACAALRSLSKECLLRAYVIGRANRPTDFGLILCNSAMVVTAMFQMQSVIFYPRFEHTHRMRVYDCYYCYFMCSPYANGVCDR